jgi:uncharacterized protein YegL
MRDFTDITFVLDRSGSMAALANDVVGGYKQFIEEQKKVGELTASMTLAQFDDQYEVVFTNMMLKDVSPTLTFVPRGWTALLDAVGKTIVATGERLAAYTEDQRPDKVVFVVFTDGYENASKEYTAERIKEMVKSQTETYKWKFLFLGANIDSFTVGKQLGVNVGTTSNYDNTSAGVKSAYGGVSSYTASLRNASLPEDALLSNFVNDARRKAG